MLDFKIVKTNNNMKRRNNQKSIYLMKHKKTFTSPRVLQTVEVILEEDFLQGPSNISSAISTGQEKEDANISGSYWE